jgi:hypothetical protein
MSHTLKDIYRDQPGCTSPFFRLSQKTEQLSRSLQREVRQHHAGEAQETHENGKGFSMQDKVGNDSSSNGDASQKKPVHETYSAFGHVLAL